MVRFPPASDREDGDLAPVTYLRGGPAAAPADGASAQSAWAEPESDDVDASQRARRGRDGSGQDRSGQDGCGQDGTGQDRSERARRRDEGLARITAHIAVGDDERGTPGRNARGDENEAGNDDEDEADDSVRSAPLQDIEVVSMRALTRRGMSRWELGDLLARREYDIEAIEAELDRLQRVDLLDDAALAETVVRTKHERKGLGRNALARELAQRHIDPAVIDEAVSAIDDEDEQAMATEMAVKRARQFSSLDAATAERRLTGYLMRRGYSSAIVREATRVALAGHGRGSGVRFR